MFFLVWGHKGYCDLLGYIIEQCPRCGTTAPFSVKQLRKKFTVYFVPTFSYGCRQYAECFACHAAFELAKDEQARVAGALMTQEQLAALIREVEQRAAQRAVEARPIEAAGRLIASSNPAVQARLDASVADAERHAMKQCPCCAESIKAEAVFCRFCRHDLAEQPRETHA